MFLHLSFLRDSVLRNQNWRYKFLSYWCELWNVKCLEEEELIRSYHLEEQSIIINSSHLTAVEPCQSYSFTVSCLNPHISIAITNAAICLSSLFKGKSQWVVSHRPVICLSLVFLKHELKKKKNVIFILKTF